MVVWCTQNAPRWPCQRCKYTTSVDIQNRAIKLVTHVESHASAVSLLESRERRSAIKAINNNNNNNNNNRSPEVVTNAEAWFSIALRPRKPEGSLGRTAQDGHLDSHTAPEL